MYTDNYLFSRTLPTKMLPTICRTVSKVPRKSVSRKVIKNRKFGSKTTNDRIIECSVKAVYPLNFAELPAKTNSLFVRSETGKPIETINWDGFSSEIKSLNVDTLKLSHFEKIQPFPSELTEIAIRLSMFGEDEEFDRAKYVKRTENFLKSLPANLDTIILGGMGFDPCDIDLLKLFSKNLKNIVLVTHEYFTHEMLAAMPKPSNTHLKIYKNSLFGPILFYDSAPKFHETYELHL
jgi:hypothetical protein